MKHSLIMVEPEFALKAMAPFELEIFERVIFRYMHGLNAEHDKRWKRWWRWVFHTGARLIFYPVVNRDGKYHAMHMKVESRLFEHQDCFPPGRVGLRAFRWWLKTGACFGHFEAAANGLVFVPSSLSYDECSDDEMREFHEDALEFLRTPYALHALWPAMTERDAATTLELLLRNPRTPESDHE